MFKKLKQKISEEQQQLQQALASPQVLRRCSPRDIPGSWLRGQEQGGCFLDP